MKRTSIIALFIALLTACGTSTASDRAAGSASGAAATDFAFLRELGFDVDQFIIFDRKAEIDYEKGYVEINKKQEDVLLKEVGNLYRTEDGDIECGFSLIGIRALPAGRTLILYNVEFGDGASRVFAIYDSEGNTTDYLDTGYWIDQHGIEVSDDYSTGESYGHLTECFFDSPSTMKLASKINRYSWRRDKETYEETILKEFWKIEKEYLYRITDEGTFELTGIKTRQSGPVEPEMAMLEEISDLKYYDDDSVIDRLNTLALRDDVKREAAKPEGQVSYRLQGIVEDLYQARTQQLFQWMSSHRDLSKNVVTGILEQCLSSGWISKEDFLERLNEMPDGNDKKYLEDLTAQWGPADAVG